jgi:S-adenosylmethionine hydrolase
MTSPWAGEDNAADRRCPYHPGVARHFTRVITTPAAARMVRDWSPPFVSLLSDFGSRDPSAGIMRGVVASIAPEAIVVDVSHDVDKFAVADGALLLWSALPYMPIGSHVAVVDPGVGTERRAVALETARGDYLVGPDNGLLIPAAARLGGVVRAHQLANPQYRLPVVSTSFHGRDLFAPAAAHLALGVPLESIGPPLMPQDLVTLGWPDPLVEDGSLTAEIIYQDTFGNLKFGALASDLHEALGQARPGDQLELRTTTRTRSRVFDAVWVETFGRVPAGDPLLYEDSFGRLCLAINQGSAAQRLRLAPGTGLAIRRPARQVGTGPARLASPTIEQLMAPEDDSDGLDAESFDDAAVEPTRGGPPAEGGDRAATDEPLVTEEAAPETDAALPREA